MIDLVGLPVRCFRGQVVRSVVSFAFFRAARSNSQPHSFIRADKSDLFNERAGES